MNIRLSPELERFVADQLAAGEFASADAVVEAAMRRFQAAASFRRALQLGVDELDRGRGAPYTPEMLERITHAASQAERGPDPADQDALP